MAPAARVALAAAFAALLVPASSSDHAETWGFSCPGSPAVVHANARVVVHIENVTCEHVMEEIKARVAGQFKTWQDPHNRGTYTLLAEDHDSLTLSRLTGDAQYTDKLELTFKPKYFGCKVHGCSESQVFSILDFSTNYCNLRMLYCSVRDGCRPVLRDWRAKEWRVEHSIGAGTDECACFPEGDGMAAAAVNARGPSGGNLPAAALAALLAAAAAAAAARLRARGRASDAYRQLDA